MSVPPTCALLLRQSPLPYLLRRRDHIWFDLSLYLWLGTQHLKVWVHEGLGAPVVCHDLFPQPPETGVLWVACAVVTQVGAQQDGYICDISLSTLIGRSVPHTHFLFLYVYHPKSFGKKSILPLNTSP